MANPLTYGGTQPNAATNPSAGVNSLSPLVPRDRNSFPLTHQTCQTERFADIMPFLSLDTTVNQDFQHTVNLDLRAPTFASPLMTTVRKHFAYTAVPKSVIYPRLWQQIWVTPKKGDDISALDTRAVFSPLVFKTNFRSLFINLSNSAASSIPTYGHIALLKAMYLYQLVFSQYSLFSYLDSNLWVTHQSDSKGNLIPLDILPYVNLANSEATDLGVEIYGSDGTSKYFQLISNYKLTQSHQIDALFEYIRYAMPTMSTAVRFVESPGGNAIDPDQFRRICDTFSGVLNSIVSYPGDYINIERIIAYQMSISQFFTSDDVDNLYTAHLWYQNLDGLVGNMYGTVTTEIPSVSWNGILLSPEPYSGLIIDDVCGFLANGSSLSAELDPVEYFISLFEIGSSLRYGDFYNAARMQPLAVGDYTAPVVSNEVSAVDMTEATLAQRFLHAVNSVRNTIRGYAQMLYGVQPDDVPVEPKFIAHKSVDLVSDLVANTAENQGQLQVNMNLHTSQPVFDIHLNQESIILGLTYYDALSLYPSYRSPFANKYLRDDYFNPMLQNIGDQPLKTLCLASGFVNSNLDISVDSIFGYLQNDAEYKQMVSTARGGFAVNDLRSWAYIRRFEDDYQLTAEDPQALVISSRFIRNQSSEFDEFFKSLSGNGVFYYHFICSYVNEIVTTAPMEYVSGVLFVDSKN